MKLSDYTVLFFAILICILLPAFIGQSVTGTAQRRQAEYTRDLTSACTAAAAQGGMADGLAFGTEEERTRAVDAFYGSLSVSMGEKSTGDIRYYVPVIVLVDNDGFYCSYNEYLNGGYQLVTTPINPYSTAIGPYQVRFWLDGQMECADTTPGHAGAAVHFNSPAEAFAAYPPLAGEIRAYLGTDADGLTDEQAAARAASAAAVNAVRAQTEYYINYHNTYNLLYEAAYTFTMPEVSGEDWASLMDRPGVISFLQGMKLSYAKGYVNVYALAGSRMVPRQLYTVAPDDEFGLLYHTDAGCPRLSGDARTVRGMEQAAAAGAYPCPECVR